MRHFVHGYKSPRRASFNVPCARIPACFMTGNIVPYTGSSTLALRTFKFHCFEIQQNSTYKDRLGPPVKFVDKFTKLTCLEIAVLWLLELRIRRGREVQTQIHTVNCNNRTSNCQYSLFSKKNPVIRIFYIFRRLAVPINPD
jgi:hypothetical protein